MHLSKVWDWAGFVIWDTIYNYNWASAIRAQYKLDCERRSWKGTVSGLGSGRSVEIFDWVFVGILFLKNGVYRVSTCYLLGPVSNTNSAFPPVVWNLLVVFDFCCSKRQSENGFQKKNTMMKGKFGKGMGLGLLTLAYVRIWHWMQMMESLRHVICIPSPYIFLSA